MSHYVLVHVAQKNKNKKTTPAQILQRNGKTKKEAILSFDLKHHLCLLRFLLLFLRGWRPHPFQFSPGQLFAI